MTDIKKKFDKKNLLTRVLSGVVIAILFFGLGIVGGYPWYVLILAVSMLALWEFYRLNDIHRNAIGIAGYVIGAAWWLLLLFDLTQFLLPFIVGAFIVFLGFYVFDYANMNAQKAMAAFFGFFYTVVILSYIYRIRSMEDGGWLVWLLCFSTWGCDVFAYFTGVVFGKHKLAPVLSPKKSIEGAVGGFVGAGFIGACYGAIIGPQLTALKMPVISCCIICLAAALVSMIGDLAASAFKRDKGVKDYSHIIPGHGGIMDRFDSIIVVAPLIYFLAVLFM